MNSPRLRTAYSPLFAWEDCTFVNQFVTRSGVGHPDEFFLEGACAGTSCGASAGTRADTAHRRADCCGRAMLISGRRLKRLEKLRTGDGRALAYTAIVWGVGLSHERSDVAGAEGFYSLEGNMCGTVMRGVSPCRGLRPHHVQRDRTGSWEVSCLAVSVA